MSKEIEINNKKYGEDNLITLKLSVKNLIIVLVFIASSFTGAYFALKSEISSVKDEVTTSKGELKKDMDKIKDEDLKIIYNQINQIDGKVQTILMMGNSTRTERVEPSILPNLNSH